jgi:serine/threonine protein kinase/tricorn protease-like protein
MEASRWKNIDRIFSTVVALPPAEQANFLATACDGDIELREEISSMLAEDANDGNLLDEPVFELGAKLLQYDEMLEQRDFAAYKIQKLLGRGGMGSVYLAEDTRLGRLVALKVLSPALVEDKESLSRFRHEARAASALSHPNIAHIYEFGEANERSYLAMEYVAGKTVRELIKEKTLTAPLALNIAKQIALALISTHERGIVHRDIKPENIIVKDNGIVKVLDFGLAKLAPQNNEKFDSQAPILSQIYTQTGMILGTVGYMSPEQIRGKELGAATDLWSLGVVLFEMLSGERPFSGETASDVHAAILKDEPLLLNESANVTGVNQIIRKALTKNIAERYQTAAEFVEDLERVQLPDDLNLRDGQRHYASGITAEYSDKNTQPNGAAKDSKVLRRLILLGSLIISVTGGWLIFQFQVERQSGSGKSPPMRMSRLTNSGSAVRAALSPDGQTLAFVLSLRGVFVRRRTASGAFSPDATPLVAPNEDQQIRGLAFSPDGRQVFFRARITGEVVHHLFRISTDGGEPVKIVDDIQSPPSFSPDGKQMVFLRTNEDTSRGDLIIADADGANERIFYTRQSPDFFSDQAQPAWSPDGKTIVCSVATRAENRERMVPLVIRVSDGQTQPVLKEPWAQIWTTQWLGDGKAFVMTGRPDKTTDNNQIWRVGFPGGEITRLTDDYNDFFGISVTNNSSGKAFEITSVILNRTSQLWKVNLASPADNPVQITQPGGDDGYGFSWARNGRVFYGSTFTGNPDIWTMNADGSDRRQLTLDLHLDSQPSVTLDGRYVIFGSMRSGIESLWRMNSDGSAQTLLVSDAKREPLAVNNDGKMVYYHSTFDGTAAMYRVPVEGGQPEKVIAGKYFPSAVSPDGKLLAASFRREGSKNYQIIILTIDEQVPRIVREFKPAEGADLPNWLRWSPDGKSIAYIVTQKGTGNLFSQPIEGGSAAQLTNFTSNRIYSFDFSPDGKQLICARGELSGYVALLTNE